MKTNPFQVKGRVHCGHCGNSMTHGETCFWYDEKFTCEECAEAADIVCDCGNYKADTYAKCYSCNTFKPHTYRNENKKAV